MKKQIVGLLKQILIDMGITDVEPVVDVPEDPKHGDYTTNVAMKLYGSDKREAISEKFKTPMELALSVIEQVKSQKSKVKGESSDHNIYKKDQKVSPLLPLSLLLQVIERVEVAPPGFINFFLTEASLITSTSSVLKEKDAYGTSKTVGAEPRRIVVEFTDPNPFKEFHIGHLYSNAVGESLCRLFEATGQIVRRVNYQGDAGLHVAKAVWGMRNLLKDERLAEIGKKPLHERVRFLGQAYAEGAYAYNENKTVSEEIKDINYLVFIAAQEYFKEKEEIKPIVDYRKYYFGDRSKFEGKLKEVRLLFEKGRSWSLDYFETIYTRLGTKFAGYYFESKVGEVGVKIVREHLDDKIFEESDGAVVYRGEKHGLHTRVFINKLGLPTYETKELGLAPTKYKDWPYDQSLIVTANEINEYFKVLIAALTDVNPELGKKTKHVGHGIVRLPEGKMSSRTGNILTGEWLLDEAKRQVLDYLYQSDRKYSKEEQELIADKAAVAAVKYSLLKVSLPSDISFDIAKSISFDGDSGPYLQYTYARCKSVLRKASDKREAKSKKQEEKFSDLSLISYRLFLNREERSVARFIMQFPDIVADSAANFAPNTLCTYLFQLAQAFNLFYAKHSILEERLEVRNQMSEGRSQRAESPPVGKTGLKSDIWNLNSHSFRLSLTAATAQVLRNGLNLLGIEVLEQM